MGPAECAREYDQWVRSCKEMEGGSMFSKTHQSHQIRVNNPPEGARIHMAAMARNKVVDEQRQAEAIRLAQVAQEAFSQPIQPMSTPTVPPFEASIPPPVAPLSTSAMSIPDYSSHLPQTSTLGDTQAHTAWLSNNFNDAWSNRSSY